MQGSIKAVWLVPVFVCAVFSTLIAECAELRVFPKVSETQWSRNSARVLAVSADRKIAKVYDRSGNLVRTVTALSEISVISLSPDGSLVAYFVASGELWIHILSTDKRSLVYSQPGDLSHVFTGLEWSPDGMELLYRVDYLKKSEGAEKYSEKTEIHVVNGDGTNDRVFATF